MFQFRTDRSVVIAASVTILLLAISTWLPLAPISTSTTSLRGTSAAQPYSGGDKESSVDSSHTNSLFNSTYHSFVLTPRLASDTKAYITSEPKGIAFSCYLDGTKPFAPTIWKVYDDLDSWGWQRSTRNNDGINCLLWPISDVLQAIGVDTTAGKFEYVAWDHKVATMHTGKYHLPTQGTYGNIYNPAQGLIVAHKNYGPRHKAKENKIPVSNVPDLQQWSDVTFLEFAHLAPSDQINKLRYVMRYQVQGDVTPDIVRRALQKCNKKNTVSI